MKITPLEFQQLTLGRLALLTGVSRSRWSRYFSGKVSITESTLNKVAQKLGMTSAELLSAIALRRQSL